MTTTMEGSSAIEQLASWAAGIELDDIPEAIRHRATMVLLDDMASAVAAHAEPEIARLFARFSGGPAEASVLTQPGLRLERSQAAMLNAIAANWCQLDEGHRKVMCHAGLYVVPPAIAEAEAENLTLGEVIRAIVLAYEIVCRFAETWTFPGNTVHPHAIWSPLGAAAALALLRRLSAVELAASMATALTFGQPGPFRHGIQGALVQNVWAGTGVVNGFRTLDCLAADITGLPTSPDDVLSGLLGAKSDHSYLTDGLGAKWALTSSYHKIHSCAQQSHAAVEAAIDLNKMLSEGPGTSEITRILVSVHALGMTMNNLVPANSLSARFSIPHIVAAVLVFGNASADVFRSSKLKDPRVTALRSQVELVQREPVLPWPHDRAASIRLEFSDGRALFSECLSAEGGPDRPYSEEQIVWKCISLTEEFYPRFSAGAALLTVTSPDYSVHFTTFIASLFSPLEHTPRH